MTLGTVPEQPMTRHFTSRSKCRRTPVSRYGLVQRGYRTGGRRRSVSRRPGPENEKSNLRLPSLRAWKPRYRTADFGPFIMSPTRQLLHWPLYFNAESTFATSCPALNGLSCGLAQRALRESWGSGPLFPLPDSGACGHNPWRTPGQRCLKSLCNRRQLLH